jgi:alkane 1-monooxygenase
MMVLAWVPQIWRKVMDERVLAHYDGDVSLTNLHPRTAEKYTAKQVTA